MKVFIRQILPKDASPVALLCLQLGYDISTEQVVENIESVLANKDHDAYVAVHENEVIGWVGVTWIFQIESRPYCEIRGLVIDRQHRNKGIGRMLIEKARQWGKEKGNNKLRLRCNIKRTEAHLFYQHLGFKEIKVQKIFETEI
jgi:GNAT superfamily N-acetyltransferase